MPAQYLLDEEGDFLLTEEGERILLEESLDPVPEKPEKGEDLRLGLGVGLIKIN